MKQIKKTIAGSIILLFLIMPALTVVGTNERAHMTSTNIDGNNSLGDVYVLHHTWFSPINARGGCHQII